ncbi:MAG: crotonase/enoyl-CoA hydratase family protein [Desulfobacterales bacterium]|mgnify:CR=1 FL=1|jgi:enoyl-CoA hydratase/carnithine racemase|nr:crotonase/enoyl-CoA hydratase family protein [Desulfobacterales bacterium]MBT7698349.1 crotonase/enoyl-CoA hydratase family protein [Desulfobacterales bacterium]
MSDIIKVSISNGVADVRLNRPENYNSLIPEMFPALVETGKSLASNRSVRAVVLSGEGKGFCAGLDFGTISTMDSTGADDFKNSITETPNIFQLAPYIWKQIPVPVIAALHGVAYGGGCQIALGADIRIAAPDLKMSVMEIKWGLIPDMGATQTLRDLVRLDIAKEITFSGRIIKAEEAERIGLVTRIADNPLEEALKMAEEIAGKNPEAIQYAKKLYEETWHGDENIGLKMEEDLQIKLVGSPNQTEAIMANFEKRPPKFKDPE